VFKLLEFLLVLFFQTLGSGNLGFGSGSLGFGSSLELGFVLSSLALVLHLPLFIRSSSRLVRGASLPFQFYLLCTLPMRSFFKVLLEFLDLFSAPSISLLSFKPFATFLSNLHFVRICTRRKSESKGSKT
jgi:hypothetical protein